MGIESAIVAGKIQAEMNRLAEETKRKAETTMTRPSVIDRGHLTTIDLEATEVKSEAPKLIEHKPQ